jgi:aspartate racemase
MKTIGLVGGTGWVSSVDYYRIINQEINKSLGGLNFARCILYSLNFGEISECTQRDDREGIYALLLDASQKLIRIGANCILICANTMHQFADRMEKEISVPLIHIATATAREIRRQKLSRVGLLGSKETMEMDFYRRNLKSEGIETLVPDADDREFIDQSITNELLKEIFKKETKERFLNIIQNLRDQGTQGIILGCTEIPLLIKEGDIDFPLFNTTRIHARAAVEFALGEKDKG